jgi:hypothetical protein
MTYPTRSEAQREAARANGSRSRGPRSPDGRSRSSRNSLKHGFTATGSNVLDLDDGAEVREYVQAWLADLGVVGHAEIEIGTSIAVKRRRLGNLEAVEERRHQAEVLHRLDEHPAMQALKLCEDTVTALDVMVDVMGSAVPAERDDLDSLLSPVDTVLEMLERVEDLDPKTFVGVRALADAVDALKILSPLQTDPTAYAAVVEKAQTSVAAVRALLPELRAAVDVIKERISADLPVPDDKDVYLRRRYAREIARRIEADLRVLRQLQDLRHARAAASGSFGQPNQDQVRAVP